MRGFLGAGPQRRMWNGSSPCRFLVVRAKRTFWRGSVPTLPQDALTVLPDFQHVLVATQRDRSFTSCRYVPILVSRQRPPVAVPHTRSVIPRGPALGI